jgi:uracil-DNA glycosylase
MIELIPVDWYAVLSDATADPTFVALESYLARERASYDVFPDEQRIFEALRLTPLDSVRAVVVGQDPYPGKGQAHGLAFSVLPGIAPPPSLRNILQELERNVGIPVPDSGSLVPWAEHGVLLLNEVLTVRSGEPGSHAGHGWEEFTDAVVRAVAAKPYPIALTCARLGRRPTRPGRGAREARRGCAPSACGGPSRRLGHARRARSV